jgi:hypothetical protein
MNLVTNEFGGFHVGDVSSRGFLNCGAVKFVVGYQRFGGPCCLHLQGDMKMDATWSSET